MKRKYFFVVLFLILVIFLSGCGSIIPPINLSGSWTMTNIITTTNNPIHDIGATTTAKCNIVDSSGSLTIYNFDIINQEFINWNTGYGTFNKPTLIANFYVFKGYGTYEFDITIKPKDWGNQGDFKVLVILDEVPWVSDYALAGDTEILIFE